jgi:hypothetical protein
LKVASQLDYPAPSESPNRSLKAADKVSFITRKISSIGNFKWKTDFINIHLYSFTGVLYFPPKIVAKVVDSCLLSHFSISRRLERNDNDIPHIGPSRIDEGDISTIPRCSQFLFEKLEEHFAIALVRLFVDIIETVLRGGSNRD